jgi:hypothetical protein
MSQLSIIEDFDSEPALRDLMVLIVFELLVLLVVVEDRIEITSVYVRVYCDCSERQVVRHGNWHLCRFC